MTDPISERALALRRLRRENPVAFVHELESLARQARTGVTRDLWAALAEMADAEQHQGSKDQPGP